MTDELTEEKIDGLAVQILEEAQIAEPKEKLYAFKALMQWLSIKAKLADKLPEESGEETGDELARIRKKLAAPGGRKADAGNGHAAPADGADRGDAEVAGTA